MTLAVPANLPCSEGEACSVTVKNANGTSNALSFKRAYTLVPVRVLAPNGDETITQGTGTTLHYSGGNFGLYVGIAKETATMETDPSSHVLGWIWSTAPGDRYIGWDGKSLCGFPGCNATTTRWTIGPGKYKVVALSHSELGKSVFYDPETGKLGNFDLSDQPFSVVAPTASIQVTYPNSGETLTQQTKPTIKWNAANIAGNTVTINLLKAGAFFRTIASQAPQSTATGSFSYVWTIPTDIPQGSDYQIEIVHAGDPNVRDVGDANFTIVPMSETVTIRGRFYDRFSGAPVAGAGILTWEGTTRYLWYTNANGEFALTATTSAITATSPKGFASWPTCYISQGIGIWRQPDNSLSVGFNPFDLIRNTTAYPVSGTEVNLGDIPLWPSVTLHLYSDIPVKFWVRYPEEGQGVGNSLYKTIHTLTHIIPLNYNVRAELIDQAGSTSYSSYTTLPLEYGCKPVTLTSQSGQYSWSPITAALISPNGGELWPQGSTPTLIWQTKGFPIDKPENVTLQLRDSVDSSRTIATVVSTSTDASSHAWAIPLTIPIGKYLTWLDVWSSYIDYRSRASDFSDAPFSITAP